MFGNLISYSFVTDIDIAMNFAFGLAQQYWWIAAPIFAFGLFWELWVTYAGLDFDERTSATLLEVQLPREYLKSSTAAMDHLLASLYHLHKDVMLYEHYLHGQSQRSYAFEIAGDEGDVRFYIRAPKERTRYVTAEIYAQFAEAEVFEVVEDYAMTRVPVDALTNPRHEWDLWGTEFFLTREDAYPLRTYIDMALEKPAVEETERVDPLVNITEALASCGPGEHFWYQIIARPEIGWEKESQKLIDKIAGKKEEVKPNAVEKTFEVLGTMFGGVLGGEPAEEEKKKEELRLTWPIGPQYDEMKAIDTKRTKLGFRCTVRSIYIARKGTFNKRHGQGMLGFFRPFVKYNGLKTDKRTVTALDYLYVKFREQSRKKDLLWRYRLRAGRAPGFILNTEELASLFHFPGKELTTPTVQRVPVKKGSAPAGLPTVA